MIMLTLRDRYDNRLKNILCYFVEMDDISIYIYEHKIQSGEYYITKYYHTEYALIKIEVLDNEKKEKNNN